MKLLNYTNTYFSIILLVLISVWAVVFYYAMFDEIYDSIDDGLDNRKMLLIARAKRDMHLLEKPQMDEYLYTVEKVDFEDYRGFKDTYRDTVMYMVNEKDFEPVRTLESVFNNNGQYYKIKLATSMVEEDDQIENLLKHTVILYLVLVLSILLINNFFLRKSWKPFYKLMDQMRNFKLESNTPIVYTPTKIEEFELLNQSVKKLLHKANATYSAQKQFIENASHELQTPLSIAINKLELLFEENQLSEDQAHQLQQVLENLERLTRLNKSLLLLSKIENQQFSEVENLDIKNLVLKILNDFAEMAEHKNLELAFSAEGNLHLHMNPDLAHILFSNLIKNALVHSIPDQKIEIYLSNIVFKISNYSENPSLKEKDLFERFEKYGTNENSTGLGLSIAKSIATQYGFTISYSFEKGKHGFSLKFE